MDQVRFFQGRQEAISFFKNITDNQRSYNACIRLGKWNRLGFKILIAVSNVCIRIRFAELDYTFVVYDIDRTQQVALGQEIDR